MWNCWMWSCCINSAKTGIDDSKLRKPLTFASYLTLTPQKSILGELQSLKSNHQAIKLAELVGLYTYCLVETNVGIQYLMLNELNGHQSNHGLFNLHLRRLPGFNPSTMRIIAGGEIEFLNGEIIKWNLKSQTFSLGGEFDQSNPNFATNRERLYLPQNKYQTIDAAQNYAQTFFSPSASSTFNLGIN